MDWHFGKELFSWGVSAVIIPNWRQITKRTITRDIIATSGQPDSTRNAGDFTVLKVTY